MSCVSTPTATQFSTVVSSSVSTSFSAQVTTLAGTTSTALTTSCLSSAAASASGNSTDVAVGSCVSSTVITSTTVIGGEVSTAQVPIEITDFFTSSVPTNTLFAPCSTDDSNTTTSPTTTPPTTTPPTTTPPTTTTNGPTTPTSAADTAASFSTEFSQSLTTVLTTPTTTFTSSQDTTLADGAVTQVVVTLTSALPPTSSVLNSSVPIATTQVNNNGGNGSSSSNLGAIIGGSVGGFVGLLAIVGALWFFCRRRRNWDDIFEKDYEEYGGSKPLTPARGRMLDLEDEPVNPAEANTEPKPYVYGLVGSTNAVSPPSLNAGLVPLAAASQPSLASHNRTSSSTPLMLNNNAPASRPGSAVGDSNTGHGGGSGISPSPSFTPSASGGRGGSPGPLGVAIPTGPAFSMPYAADAESPTSLTAPRGALFVANQLDPVSPPGSPTLGSPASPASAGSAGTNHNRNSMSNVAGPSFAGAMAAAEKQRLQRDDTVSSRSVYSQASRAQSPPVGKNPGAQRRASGVVVHTDAGRAMPPDQPPAYQD